jgi:hypothetical protein
MYPFCVSISFGYTKGIQKCSKIFVSIQRTFKNFICNGLLLTKFCSTIYLKDIKNSQCLLKNSAVTPSNNTTIDHFSIPEVV